MHTVGKSDCDMFNADPAWLQDQGLDRTKIITNKKKKRVSRTVGKL